MSILQKTDSGVNSSPTLSFRSGNRSKYAAANSCSNVSTPQPSVPMTKNISSLEAQTAVLVSPLPNAVTFCTLDSSGNKNNLKGTKLARRARSFKDDIISLMRTTNNTLGRSNSPHSLRNKNAKQPPTAKEFSRSTLTLETHLKDISNALKHFRDVILKKKLEVLPGNGTVILETIASMYSVIQSCALKEHGTVLLSATQQVNNSLGKLIKLCDEIMISEESSECVSLGNENVREIVDLLEEAVRNLVTLAQERLKGKVEYNYHYSSSDEHFAMEKNICEVTVDNASDSTSSNKSTKSNDMTTNSMPHNYHIMRPVETNSQRTSLPDITLTPKERDILEKTNTNSIRASYSSESILRDTSPPPKPPLPNRISNPPPLPPKRHSHQQSTQQIADVQQNRHNISINSLDYSSDFSLMNYVDHFLVRSPSPDENSSQCSIDSALNYSREEKLKVAHTENSDQLDDSDGDRMHCHSFVSMKSFRTSAQGISNRSSHYSFQSSTKSSCSNSEFNFGNADVKSTIGIATNDDNTCEKQLSNTNTITNQQPTKVFISMNASEELNAASSIAPKPLNCTESPPALPPKLLRQSFKSHHKQCSSDQFDELGESAQQIAELRQHHEQTSQGMERHQCQQNIFKWQSKHQSLSDPRNNDHLVGSCMAICSVGQNSTEIDTGIQSNCYNDPPPLPIKKKHILAYMEICSASTRTIEQHRHTMHVYNLSRNMAHSQSINIVPLSKNLNPENETPPALPPKNYTPRSQNVLTTPAVTTIPKNIPKINTLCEKDENSSYCIDNAIADDDLSSSRFTMTSNSEEISDDAVIEENVKKNEVMTEHSAYPICNTEYASKILNDLLSPSNGNSFEEKTNDSQFNMKIYTNDEDEGIDVVSGHKKNYGDYHPDSQFPNMLEEIDVTPYLIVKKENEDGPEVKGGYIDALIVHASHVQKIADNAFSEAFITTFRTFIQPIDVIEKLTYRYTSFICQLNDQKQKAAKETFSLLVRIVNDLTSSDLTGQLLTLLIDFIHQLVCSGQLYLAKLLRNKFVEKVTLYKEQKVPSYHTDMYITITNQPSILDLRSMEIAEQMTLLDAELFQKIEIPEVLLFAKEQCEEKSPNLNKFTEHFNKMSYWVRSKILMLHDAREREKHMIKFIKIMKYLRKMNNFNSYLALLSALDSAPIRRLEWQKNIIESLKEYCTLIDSSSSFRVYRQALAETNPPCIPYIGLVLQDLTFVHVGNQDYLTKEIINFSKRWQQYNIIVNMKRFKKCSYPFRRNDRIIQFFENFENFLGEEEMWQISETIKPRGKRPNNY